MEKLTRAVLSSDDGGVPLSRFAGDYLRMTKTEFPWKEYGFSSARDMLLSMENVVEFKFLDEENQFYLVPAHVTNTSKEVSRSPIRRIKENRQINSTVVSGGISDRIHHSSNNSTHSITGTITSDDIPALVEVEENNGFTVDHLGRVSVYVTQSKEKPAKNYWNVRIVFFCDVQ